MSAGKTRNSARNEQEVSVMNRAGSLNRSRSQRSISSRKSGRSQRSNLTENPMHYENSVVHKNAGFTDAESKQYREFDQAGRTQNAFQQRAALAGIKNL